MFKNRSNHDFFTGFLGQYEGDTRLRISLGLVLIGLDDIYQEARTLPLIARIRVRARIRSITRELGHLEKDGFPYTEDDRPLQTDNP